MKERYHVFRRENGVFYSVNTVTKQRHSLETSDPAVARRIINAKNEACQQPAIDLQIAKAYLAAADPRFIKRNWAEVMTEFVKTKPGCEIRHEVPRGMFDVEHLIYEKT